MVLVKSELIAQLQKEVDILVHLSSKIDRSKLDYRPTPKQRSTLELLRYLSIMGPALVQGAKTQFDVEAWQAANPERPYGRPFGIGPNERPGLHVSCLEFLRDHDVSVLVWDMLDHLPVGYDIPWAVHAALFAYGVALVDNALLEPLARACVEEQRDEFMLIVAPLVVVGGTGSPANPLAVF